MCIEAFESKTDLKAYYVIVQEPLFVICNMLFPLYSLLRLFRSIMFQYTYLWKTLFTLSTKKDLKGRVNFLSIYLDTKLTKYIFLITT